MDQSVLDRKGDALFTYGKIIQVTNNTFSKKKNFEFLFYYVTKVVQNVDNMGKFAFF